MWEISFEAKQNSIWIRKLKDVSVIRYGEEFLCAVENAKYAATLWTQHIL